MANEVKLDGKNYAVRGQIRTQAFDPWPEPLRIVGNLQRRDRTNANQWIQESFRSGLGYYRAVGDPPANPDTGHPSYRGFFNSTLETRWGGQISLPAGAQAMSHTNDGTSGEPDHNYSGLFKARSSAAYPGIYAWSDLKEESIAYWSGSAWTEAKDLTSGYTNYRPTAVTEYQGTWQIWGGVPGACAAKIVTINAGGSFADDTASTPMSHYPLDVVIFKGLVHYAVTWERANGVLQIETSTDGGDTWADVAGLEISVMYPSGVSSINAWAKLVEYFDADGDPALYLVTNNGLYLIDLSGADILPIIKFQTDVTPTTDTKPLVWNGNLYIPRGKSLVKFNFNGSWEEISPMELGTVPTDMLGSAIRKGFTSLTASDRWLFCAINGVTGAYIFAYDGEGWHYVFALDGSSALKTISSIMLHDTLGGGAIDLVVLVQDANPSTSDSTFYRLRKILEDPLNNSGYAGRQFATSGTIITPWFDGGMSEVDSTILASGGGFKGLASGKSVKVETALEYSDTYQTNSATIATFTSDTDGLIRYGASTTRGPGISARAWRHRYTLVTDSNTATPALFYPVTYYKKKPPQIHEVAFLVDLEETVRLNQYEWTSADDVLEALNDAAISSVLLSLDFPGKNAVTNVADSSTLYVEVQGIPAQHVGGGSPAQWLPEVESGTALVVCRQVFED